MNREILIQKLKEDKPSEPDMPPNGLRPDQVAKEGTDQFIQEDRYLSAYTAYFARFIQDYAKQGIRIGIVMQY